MSITLYYTGKLIAIKLRLIALLRWKMALEMQKSTTLIFDCSPSHLIYSTESPSLWNLKKIQKVSTRVLSDSVTTGDIALKLQDGSCFSLGKLSEPISSLKKQIQGLLGFPMADQRLFTCRGSVQDQELVDDWRSLASSGLSKGDTLLLIRRPWMQCDPETKSLKLQLPEPCARCALYVSLCPLLVRQSLFLSYPALFPLVGSTRRRSLPAL